MKHNKLNTLFWAPVWWLIVLFVWGLIVSGKVDAHGTHLSGQGDLTQTSISSCDGGFAVHTEELGCIYLYKAIDLTHSGVHIETLQLDEDGDCSCPEEEND